MFGIIKIIDKICQVKIFGMLLDICFEYEIYVYIKQKPFEDL